MARIHITTDEGEVVEVFTDREIGDLTKPLNASSFALRITDQIKKARILDAADRARKGKKV